MTFLSIRICRIAISVLRNARQFATLKNSGSNDTRQNLTEKIVQRYAVDLPAGKLVKSGDYVSIKPQHCMSHDNCTDLPFPGLALISHVCGQPTNCSLASCIEVPILCG